MGHPIGCAWDETTKATTLLVLTVAAFDGVEEFGGVVADAVFR